MAEITVPCATCSGTGWATHEDRHTETRQDQCRACGGTGQVPARPGESRETSWPDAGPGAAAPPPDDITATIRKMFGRAIEEEGRLADAADEVDALCDQVVDYVRTALLSRLRSTPPGGSGQQAREEGRRPDGPGLSSSGPSPAVSAPAGASIPGADAGPSPGLLMSMAMRSDHAIAHKGYYDWERFPGMGERMPGRHAKRLAAVMSSMRQIWEEVVGCGFYAAHKEADYAALAADLGVTFTDSGHPIAARASDEQPKAEDPKGLSPQGASAADEVGAPGSLDQASREDPVSQPSPVDGANGGCEAGSRDEAARKWRFRRQEAAEDAFLAHDLAPLRQRIGAALDAADAIPRPSYQEKRDA